MKTECGMRADIESVLFTEEKIQEIVQRVGGEISRDYKDKNLLLVSVLKGSVVFYGRFDAGHHHPRPH